MARNDPQINVRLPSDLKAQLEETARKNGRSVTAEIISLVNSGINEPYERTQLVEKLHTQQGLIEALEKMNDVQKQTIRSLEVQREATREFGGLIEAMLRFLANQIVENKDRLPDGLVDQARNWVGVAAMVPKIEQSDASLQDRNFLDKWLLKYGIRSDKGDDAT